MAFLLQSTNDGRVPAWEYIPASGFIPKMGMALKISDDKLVAATGISKPEYICMKTGKTTVTVNDPPIPVIRVESDMIFEVPTNSTSLMVGDEFSLSSDSLRITGGSGSGVVEKILGNGYVRVRI